MSIKPHIRTVSRARWGARRPKAGLVRQSDPREFFVHYSAGRGRGIDTFREQRAAMREMQRLHMDVNGWSDIGYAFVVFQPYGRLRRVRTFDGRPTRFVPAAQAGHNTGTVPVCVVMRDGEPLKRRTKNKLKSLYRHSGCDRARGHHEVNATACPGRALKAFLPELRRTEP